jgi:hypothetical protein
MVMEEAVESFFATCCRCSKQIIEKWVVRDDARGESYRMAE